MTDNALRVTRIQDYPSACIGAKFRGSTLPDNDTQSIRSSRTFVTQMSYSLSPSIQNLKLGNLL